MIGYKKKQSFLTRTDYLIIGKEERLNVKLMAEE
jgi:hypothetical protein